MPGSVCSCATEAELRFTGFDAVAFAFAVLVAAFAPCGDATDGWATPIVARITSAIRNRCIAVLQEEVKARHNPFRAVRSGRLVYGAGCPRHSSAGQRQRHRGDPPQCSWKVLSRRGFIAELKWKAAGRSLECSDGWKRECRVSPGRARMAAYQG